MMRKKSSEELINEYRCSPPPALKEYLLMHSAPFLEAFCELADEYLSGYDAFMYQHYTNVINEEYEDDADDERKKRPHIAELLIKGHREQNEELSTAILYTVFLYPMEIIRARKNAQKSPGILPGIPEDPEDWGLPFK